MWRATLDHMRGKIELDAALAEVPDVETTPGQDIARSEIDGELTGSGVRGGIHQNRSTLGGDQVVEGDAGPLTEGLSGCGRPRRQLLRCPSWAPRPASKTPKTRL